MRLNFLIILILGLAISSYASPNVEDLITKQIEKELNCQRVEIKFYDNINKIKAEDVKKINLALISPNKQKIILETNRGEIFQLSCQITAYDRVYLTRKPLSKGQIIDETDFYESLLPLHMIPANAIKNIDDIVKKELSRSVGTGIAITKNMIKSSDMISKGQKVSIVIDTENIKISVKGQLQEASSVGSLVKVLNLNSKKVITGRLLDSNTVIMDF